MKTLGLLGRTLLIQLTGRTSLLEVALENSELKLVLEFEPTTRLFDSIEEAEQFAYDDDYDHDQFSSRAEEDAYWDYWNREAAEEQARADAEREAEEWAAEEHWRMMQEEHEFNKQHAQCPKCGGYYLPEDQHTCYEDDYTDEELADEERRMQEERDILDADIDEREKVMAKEREQHMKELEEIKTVEDLFNWLKKTNRD